MDNANEKTWSGFIGPWLIENSDYTVLYNNEMNACTLIGQSAMVYCASKLMEIIEL